MKVLAFDQATVTGWCFGTTSLKLKDWPVGRFRAPKRPHEGERLIIIEDSALDLIDRYDPDFLAYEEPYDPSWDNAQRAKRGEEIRAEYNRTTMNFLQGVKHALLMAAARKSIPIEGYPTRSWRSILQLPKPPSFDEIAMRLAQEAKEHQTKEWMRNWQRKWTKTMTLRKVKMLGGQVETEDEADAFGIAMYALHGKPGDQRKQQSFRFQEEVAL